MFAVAGDKAGFSADGYVARGTSKIFYSWVRMNTGFDKGTHTWRLRVRLRAGAG